MRTSLRAALGFGVGLLALNGSATTAKAYFCPETVEFWQIDNLLIQGSQLYKVEGPGDTWNTTCYYKGWYALHIGEHVEKMWNAAAYHLSEAD